MRLSTALAMLIVLALSFPAELSSLENKSHKRPCSRRAFGAALVGSSAFSVLMGMGAPPAHAARGAAELDLEYYLRDLVGGNAKEGTILPSAPPPMPPPRQLSGPLLPLLLDNDCTPSCIPMQSLMERVPRGTDVQERVLNYRSRAREAFQVGAAWKTPDVSDQYYFDLTSYALWRTAADVLPDYVERDRFARDIGKRIYSELTKAGIIEALPARDKKARLTSTVATTKEIMDLFVSSGYCKSYKVGDDTKPSGVVFDEFDDEDIAAGATVDFLLSVYEPATLRASLQITGEQSRFAPEYVGSTLEAMWSSVGVSSSLETYFVDPEYRPNPKDYFPNEQLLQFTLKKS